MDNHSWGNTRMVAGEGSEKKIIADADDHFDDSMIPLKRFSGKSTLLVNHLILLYVLISWNLYRIRARDVGERFESRT